MLVSVYIRKEDEDLWRELPKKSEAIHALLHGQKIAEVFIDEVVNEPIKLNPLATFDPKKKAAFDDLKDLISSGGVPASVIEPEGTMPTCCSNKKKLCKHWVWDGNAGGHTNSLSSEFLEAPAW